MYKSKQAGQLYMESTFKPDADSVTKQPKAPAAQAQTIVQPIVMQAPPQQYMQQPMY
jgi:hypothetical protein